MIKELFSQLTRKFNSGNEEASPQPNSDSPINQLTTDKIKAIVADLTNAEDIFEEAGFVMQQLEIEIGLKPKIVPQFKQLRTIELQQESAIIQQLSDRKLLRFVVQSLFKSSRMKMLLENTDMELSAIEISVSAPPSVKTIFKRVAPIDTTADITHH